VIDIALKEDGGQWVARGLNIDYVAAGATADEARLNFWQGLAQTFHENQQQFGSVEKVMRAPPAADIEAWIRHRT
jgi:hypothetical protein